MNRLTTDKIESFNPLNSVNMFFVKDRWVHIRGAYGNSDSISLVDWVKQAAKANGVDLPNDFEDFEDALHDDMFYGFENLEGILAMLYYAAVQAAVMRERLKKIEDILGDSYDLDRLRELVQAERAELPDSDWVCVTERLPENEGEYLFYTKFDEMFVAHICKDELDPDSWVIDADYTPSSITHWRLIPEPPKEKS